MSRESSDSDSDPVRIGRMPDHEIDASKRQLQFVLPEKEQLSKYEKWKRKMWQLFDNPTSTRLALAISLFIMFLILLSTFNFLIETMPQWVKEPPPPFFYIEAVCIAVFTVEFSIRLWACPNKKKFWKGPLNVIDFLAIVPFYIELASGGGTGGLAVLRVIRLTRVFRIFKIGRYASSFLVVLKAISRSVDGFFLLLFFLSCGMILFSSFMWYAEQTGSEFEDDEWVYVGTFEDDNPNPYQSIPHTLWWSIVTITTVGYGDTFPVTPVGKAVAGLTFMAGILIIAFPITILGTKFSEAFEENKIEERQTNFIREHKHDDLEQRSELMFARVEGLGETIKELDILIGICKERYELLKKACEEAAAEGKFAATTEEEALLGERTVDSEQDIELSSFPAS